MSLKMEDLTLMLNRVQIAAKAFGLAEPPHE